jgi:putative flippase GtrA
VNARLRKGSRQFVKFALVGALGTIVNLSVLRLTLFAWELAHAATPFAFELFASSLAFSCAVVNNYFWNRRWTFRSHGSVPLEFGKFLTVSLAGLALNALAFYVFRGRLGIHVVLSQILAIGCVLPFNFVVNKLWSFRGS